MLHYITYLLMFSYCTISLCLCTENGRNAQHCSSSVFEVTLDELAVIKKSAWSLLCQNWFTNSLCNVNQITELLPIAYAFLPQLSASEIDCVNEYLCTE